MEKAAYNDMERHNVEFCELPYIFGFVTFSASSEENSLFRPPVLICLASRDMLVT